MLCQGKRQELGGQGWQAKEEVLGLWPDFMALWAKVTWFLVFWCLIILCQSRLTVLTQFSEHPLLYFIVV